MNDRKRIIFTALFFLTFFPLFFYFNYQRYGIVLEYFLYIGGLSGLVLAIYLGRELRDKLRK